MEIGDIFSLGKFGMGLFSSSKAKKGYKEQAKEYEGQDVLNRQIGALNAAVVEYTGEETVSAILLETKKLMGAQRVMFARNGIEMSGSPMFVLGETFTMGSKRAQEAYFNMKIDKINKRYGAIEASAVARGNADRSRWNAKSESLNIFKQVIEGTKMIRAWSAADGLTNKKKEQGTEQDTAEE